MFLNTSSFDQNISSLCVQIIGTKPNDFDTRTSISWITVEKPDRDTPC